MKVRNNRPAGPRFYTDTCHSACQTEILSFATIFLCRLPLLFIRGFLAKRPVPSRPVPDRSCYFIECMLFNDLVLLVMQHNALCPVGCHGYVR